MSQEKKNPFGAADRGGHEGRHRRLCAADIPLARGKQPGISRRRRGRPARIQQGSGKGDRRKPVTTAGASGPPFNQLVNEDLKPASATIWVT